jgi:hypothetical protein
MRPSCTLVQIQPSVYAVDRLSFLTSIGFARLGDSALKATIWEVRSWNGGTPGPRGFPSNSEETASTARSALGYYLFMQVWMS